jgi:hypothetical protein
LDSRRRAASRPVVAIQAPILNRHRQMLRRNPIRAIRIHNRPRRLEDPAVLWTRCVQLTQIEPVFGPLKNELGIRPVYHPLDHRANAHLLIAFLA